LCTKQQKPSNNRAIDYIEGPGSVGAHGVVVKQTVEVLWSQTGLRSFWIRMFLHLEHAANHDKENDGAFE